MRNNKAESLVRKDGSVQVIKPKNYAIGKHLCVLYSLLILSFTLHLYTILSQNLLRNGEIFKDRGRRSVDERNVDPSLVPSANVEFIHPKLREDMKDEDEDPQNPWVWLTSYSRVPVMYSNMQTGYIYLPGFMCINCFGMRLSVLPKICKTRQPSSLKSQQTSNIER